MYLGLFLQYGKNKKIVSNYRKHESKKNVIFKTMSKKSWLKMVKLRGNFLIMKKS